MGMSANLGTKVNRRKRAIRLDPNIVKNVGLERDDEGDRVVVKIDDVREGVEEVLFDELLLRYPKLFTTVIDNGVLVGVSVDGEGTSGGMEEVWKKVLYRLFA